MECTSKAIQLRTDKAMIRRRRHIAWIAVRDADGIQWRLQTTELPRFKWPPQPGVPLVQTPATPQITYRYQAQPVHPLHHTQEIADSAPAALQTTHSQCVPVYQQSQPVSCALQ